MSPFPEHLSRFEAWWAEHRGIVIKVARSFAPDPADAADLQQEMLLRLWSSLGSFTGQSKPSTWIYRVCLNTALTWRRGRIRRDRHHEPGVDIGAVPADTVSPADYVGNRESLERLYAAIHALPKFERAVVLLALDGLAYREMAEITGLTENHVGVVLTRARKRLAELMKGTVNELG